MSAGAVGLNLHGQPLAAPATPSCACRTPPSPPKGGLHAQPDWYAMLLARTLIGYRPMPTKITAAGAPNWPPPASRARTRASSCCSQTTTRPARCPLVLRIGVGAGVGQAKVLRLTDASPYDKAGVRIGGHEVGGDGSWHEPAGEPAPVSGGYVTVEDDALFRRARHGRCRSLERAPRSRGGSGEEAACRRSGAARP